MIISIKLFIRIDIHFTLTLFSISRCLNGVFNARYIYNKEIWFCFVQSLIKVIQHIFKTPFWFDLKQIISEVTFLMKYSLAIE